MKYQLHRNQFYLTLPLNVFITEKGKIKNFLI